MSDTTETVQPKRGPGRPPKPLIDANQLAEAIALAAKSMQEAAKTESPQEQGRRIISLSRNKEPIVCAATPENYDVRAVAIKRFIANGHTPSTWVQAEGKSEFWIAVCMTCGAGGKAHWIRKIKNQSEPVTIPVMGGPMNARTEAQCSTPQAKAQRMSFQARPIEEIRALQQQTVGK